MKVLSFLYRYGAVIFMVNTIFLSAYIFGPIGKLFFYAILGIFLALITLQPHIYLKITFSEYFLIFLLINIINILHFFLFDRNLGSFQYLITKIIVFYIISTSIFYNARYYLNGFIKHFIWIGIFFAITSILYAQNFGSGYHGIIGNRNEFGILMSTTLGVIYLYKERHSNKERAFMLFLLFLVLMSGSRNALVGVILAWIFKNGITWRMVSFVPFIIAAYYLLDYIGIETTFDRMAQESDQFADRRWEFYYGWKTFLNKLWTGYGLDHYAYIDQSLVHPYLFKMGAHVMAHNSYLAGMVMYGLPFFAAVMFSILFIAIPGYIKYIFGTLYKSHSGIRIYFYILTYTMVSSIVESHMFGVNAFHGFMFWFSLGMVGFIQVAQKRGVLEELL